VNISRGNRASIHNALGATADLTANRNTGRRRLTAVCLWTPLDGDSFAAMQRNPKALDGAESIRITLRTTAIHSAKIVEPIQQICLTGKTPQIPSIPI
jgi:hypothetical protein